MARSIGSALVIVAPVAIAATVLLNLADASRPLALGVTLTICAIGSALAVSIDHRRQAGRSRHG
jgi:hypothetical protein